MHQYKLLNLRFEFNNSICIAAINRPPANLINEIMIDEIDTLLGEFFLNQQSKVLVLHSALDRVFIGGADINEILAIDSPSEGVRLARKGQELCNKIEFSKKPIIAAINGYCIGGGNEIAMACHMRTASEKAKFQQPEINLGIIPAFGGTQRLPRIIGQSRARKMILTGAQIDIKDAINFGLVDEALPHNDLMQETIRLAHAIASKSSHSIGYCQEAIGSAHSQSLAQGLEMELNFFYQICKTRDMKEGLLAIKEKRLPKFKDQ